MAQARYDLSTYEYLRDPDNLETTSALPQSPPEALGNRENISTDYNNLATLFASPDQYLNNPPAETSTPADRFDFAFENTLDASGNTLDASYKGEVFGANLKDLQPRAYNHYPLLTQGYHVSNGEAAPDNSWYPARFDVGKEKGNVDRAKTPSRGSPDKRPRLGHLEETLGDRDDPTRRNIITASRASSLSKLRTSSRAAERKAHSKSEETAGDHKLRASHNIVEKQYRNRLNKKFEALLDVLPPGMRQDEDGDGSEGSGRPVSKAEVLTLARRYILELQRDRDTAVNERRAMVNVAETLQSRLRNEGNLDRAYPQ
ncbi:HLH-domain-containing protein [Thozetella sp. PMI_491]|nr:HLH-domain-containing protein [Thozetella sp. PMI_491]